MIGRRIRQLKVILNVLWRLRGIYEDAKEQIGSVFNVACMPSRRRLSVSTMEDAVSH